VRDGADQALTARRPKPRDPAGVDVRLQATLSAPTPTGPSTPSTAASPARLRSDA